MTRSKISIEASTQENTIKERHELFIIMQNVKNMLLPILPENEHPSSLLIKALRALVTTIEKCIKDRKTVGILCIESNGKCVKAYDRQITLIRWQKAIL